MPEDTDEMSAFESGVLDVEVVTEGVNHTVIEVAGTQLHLQAADVAPMLVEIFVEDEERPLAAFNTARGETVTLGGIEEGLAAKIEALCRTPLEDITTEIEALTARINPPRYGATDAQ